MTNTLNPDQKKAVAHSEGPLLVIAGAGSGKTRVLTQKISHLIHFNGIPRDQILAITFTNKAAKEMKARVIELIGKEALMPTVGTFHSVCAMILRDEFHLLGRSSHYIIYDSGDQLSLMRQLIKSLNLGERFKQPQEALSLISKLKNNLIGPENLVSSHPNYSDHLKQIYTAYQNALKLNNAIDFDDMLFFVIQLFETQPAALKKYQDKYQYVLIDEYQDTNHAQYFLCKLLTQTHNNICAVGDFDQTIYSWRGAKLQNILQFEQDFPGTKTIALEQNYRSTGHILGAANGVIKNNSQRRPKNLWTENNDGEPVTVYFAYDEVEEATFVADQLRTLKQDKDFSFNNCAILYRTNAQSRIIEEVFNRQNIPYRLVGGVRFYARQEVKDIVSYLHLVENIHDNLALARVVQRPTRGVGQTSIEKMVALSQETGKSIVTLSDEGLLPVSQKQTFAMKALFDMIRAVQQVYATSPENKISNCVHALIELSGYKGMLESDSSDNAMERLENLMEFASISEDDTKELGDFLNDLSLMSVLDATKDSGDAVTLMTLHHAKGLEYPIVFIVGVEDGLLPYFRTKGDAEGMEEERRLMYVGITRGEERVYLVATNQRTLFGDLWFHNVSPFIKELPKEHSRVLVSERVVDQNGAILDKLRESGIAYDTLFAAGKPIIGATSVGITSLATGDVVKHKVWGTGVVKAVEGAGEKMMVKVGFSDETRNLMTKYAPLEKL